jgi:hypothetical protein
MDGFAQMAQGANDQADQVLAADADLLEQACGVLRRHAAQAGAWRSVPLRATASLLTAAAARLRRLHSGYHGPAEPDLPELLD